MLGVDEILEKEEQYKTIRLNKEEIRLVEIAIANEILEINRTLNNEDNISEYKSIDLETRKSDYCKILNILKYLER